MGGWVGGWGCFVGHASRGHSGAIATASWKLCTMEKCGLMGEAVGMGKQDEGRLHGKPKGKTQPPAWIGYQQEP